MLLTGIIIKAGSVSSHLPETRSANETVDQSALTRHKVMQRSSVGTYAFNACMSTTHNPRCLTRKTITEIQPLILDTGDPAELQREGGPGRARCGFKAHGRLGSDRWTIMSCHERQGRQSSAMQCERLEMKQSDL